LDENTTPDSIALQKFQLIRCCALIVICILLAKSGLGETGIGQLGIAILIAGTFCIPGSMIPTILVKLSKGKSRDQQKIIVFNSFLFLFLLSILTSALFFFSHNAITQFLPEENKIPVPLVLGLFILINGPTRIIESIYLINSLSKKILTYRTIISALQLLIVGLLPCFGFGLPTILGGLLCIAIVKFGWLIVVMFRYSKAKPDRSIRKEMRMQYVSSMTGSIPDSSVFFIAGFILISKFPPNDLAVFQYGLVGLPLLFLISNSFERSMLPYIVQRESNSSLAELRSEVYRLIWRFFPLSVMLILTSHWLFPIVFNPHMTDSATIFNISLLLVTCRVLFPQTLLRAKNKNNIVDRISFLGICITFIMGLWLSNLIGTAGIAYGIVIASIIEKASLMIACKRKLAIAPSKYLPLRIYTISTTLLILTFIFVEFIRY